MDYVNASYDGCYEGDTVGSVNDSMPKWLVIDSVEGSLALLLNLEVDWVEDSVSPLPEELTVRSVEDSVRLLL